MPFTCARAASAQTGFGVAQADTKTTAEPSVMARCPGAQMRQEGAKQERPQVLNDAPLDPCRPSAGALLRSTCCQVRRRATCAGLARDVADVIAPCFAKVLPEDWHAHPNVRPETVTTWVVNNCGAGALTDIRAHLHCHFDLEPGQGAGAASSSSCPDVRRQRGHIHSNEVRLRPQYICVRLQLSACALAATVSPGASDAGLRRGTC